MKLNFKQISVYRWRFIEGSKEKKLDRYYYKYTLQIFKLTPGYPSYIFNFTWVFLSLIFQASSTASWDTFFGFILIFQCGLFVSLHSSLLFVSFWRWFLFLDCSKIKNQESLETWWWSLFKTGNTKQPSKIKQHTLCFSLQYPYLTSILHNTIF